MPSHMTTRRIPELFDRLDRDGHIEDRPAVEAFVLERQGETELPLYIRVLIGVGAAIAAAFFIVFLLTVDLIDFNDAPGMLPTGLVFVAAAIGLNRLSGTARTVANSFLLQASFAAMATGKFLFVIGFDGILDTYWAVSLAMLLVTAAMYHVYRMSIDRFLSSLMVLLSVLVNIVWGDETTLPREPLIIGYARHDKLLLVLGALLMPAFLWLYYYSLDFSLLTKSLILTGSGVILLAGHFYLAHTVQNSEA